MKLQFYQIDAFTHKIFQGNPACVVPLEQWLPDETLLKIAQENAVAETAFFLRTVKSFIFDGSPRRLKWTYADMPHWPPHIV